MQIKNIPPASFLVFRTQTTVDQLAQFLPVGQDLFREAVDKKLLICGPVHWHYDGFTGDEKKPFTLEVALPVATMPSKYEGKYLLKTTNSFLCVSETHEGAWTEIPATYGKMFEFITSQDLKPITLNREVYVHVDMQNPEANVAEIQIGIERT